MPGESHLDTVNRPTWSQTAGEFTQADSWTDPGERAVLTMLAPRLRAKRMIDVGVGAGRTAWLMRLLTDDYVAIDYTPEMIDAAKRSHPDLDMRVGDARDLSSFADESLDFVMFSWNGLDALSHDDRQVALDEFHRVLVPRGTLLFSTLDKSGSAYREAPWTRTSGGNAVKRAVKFSVRLPSNVGRYRRELGNWSQLSKRIEDHGDWGISPLAAQDYGLLVHYITPDAQRRELEQHGFAVETMVDNVGRPIDSATPDGERVYFHVVATRL